jgi:putative membrane protein
MQFPFFQVISHVLPFTYVIHGQGAIIYGIGSGTNLMQNSLYVLQMCGILLIFALVFTLLGVFNAKFRTREILYGSCSSKKMYQVLKSMKLNKYLNTKEQKVL